MVQKNQVSGISETKDREGKDYPPEIVKHLLELRDRFAKICNTDEEDTKDQIEIKSEVDRLLQELDTLEEIHIFINGVQVGIQYISGKRHQRKYRCCIGNESVEISVSMRRMILDLIISENIFIIYQSGQRYYNMRDLKNEEYPLSKYFEFARGKGIRFNPGKNEIKAANIFTQSLVIICFGDENIALGFTRDGKEIVVLLKGEISNRILVKEMRPEMVNDIKNGNIQVNPGVDRELGKIGLKAVRHKDDEGRVYVKLERVTN